MGWCEEMLAFWWGPVCVEQGPRARPASPHRLPSVLALAVCREGAEGRGGHRLTAQPHVICLSGKARVNIQLGFCFVGTRGTWQCRQRSPGLALHSHQRWPLWKGVLWAVPGQGPEPPVTITSWLILKRPYRELK